MKFSLDTLNVPKFLVVTTTLGFFMLLALMYFKAFPTESKDILNTMLGSVGAAWTSIVGYYFGSSSGSAKKTDIIAQPANGKTETE